MAYSMGRYFVIAVVRIEHYIANPLCPASISTSGEERSERDLGQVRGGDVVLQPLPR